MADAWVNLVQHRLPTPNASAPKKPELRAVAAPTSPSNTQKSERASRKDFGWFWITRKRNAGPLTFTRPSALDSAAGSGAVSPAQLAEQGPSLSRASSGDSWLEVTNNGSSDDLTDLDDSNLVSVAPRPEPRVIRSIRIASLGSSATAPSIGGRRMEHSDAAPAGSRSSDSADAPELPSMNRARDAASREAAPAGIRMRSAATKERAAEHCTGGPGAAGSNGTVGHGEGHSDTEGSLSMARVAAACGVSPDSDLLWTFLAGMMLYFMSV